MERTYFKNKKEFEEWIEERDKNNQRYSVSLDIEGRFYGEYIVE